MFVVSHIYACLIPTGCIPAVSDPGTFVISGEYVGQFVEVQFGYSIPKGPTSRCERDASCLYIGSVFHICMIRLTV